MVFRGAIVLRGAFNVLMVIVIKMCYIHKSIFLYIRKNMCTMFIDFFRKKKDTTPPTPPPMILPLSPKPKPPPSPKTSASESVAPLNARMMILKDIALNDKQAVSDLWKDVSKNKSYTYSYEHLLYDMLCQSIFLTNLDMLQHIISLPFTTHYAINSKARLYCFLAHANEDLYRVIISRYSANIVKDDVCILWKKRSPYRNDVLQAYIQRDDVVYKRETIVSLLPYHEVNIAIATYETLTSKQFKVLESEIRDLIMSKRDELTTEFVANIKPYLKTPVASFIMESINNSFNTDLWITLLEKYGAKGIEFDQNNIYNVIGCTSVDHYKTIQSQYDFDRKKTMLSAALWNNMPLLKLLADSGSHIQLLPTDILYLIILRWQMPGPKKRLDSLDWFFKNACSRNTQLSHIVVFNMPCLSLLNDLCFMKLLQRDGLMPLWLERDVEEYVKCGRNCDIPYSTLSSHGLRYLASLIRVNISLQRQLLLEAIEKEMYDVSGHGAELLSECDLLT